MNTLSLSQLESALLDRLGALHVSSGGVARTLRGVGDPWPASRHHAALALPAILLRYGGWRAATPGSGQAGGWARWIMTVAVGGGRWEVARRSGTGTAAIEDWEGSAWNVARELRDLLNGWAPLRGVGPMIRRAEAPGPAEPGWAVVEQTWECSLPGAGHIEPLFALGFGSISASTPAIAPDDTSIELGEMASFFDIDAPLFLALADGSSNVCLGRILTIDSGLIEYERPAGVAYPAGSVAWSPTVYHRWATGRRPSCPDTVDSGIEMLSLGEGDAVAARIQAPRRTTQASWGPIARASIDSARAWVEVHCRSGLDAFTWAGETGGVYRARLSSSVWTLDAVDDGLATVSIELALGEPGSRDT